MSVKYYDKIKKEWVIFPGTMGVPGKDAYQMAVDNGYTGTKDEYINDLLYLSKVPDEIQDLKDSLSGYDSEITLTSDKSIIEMGVSNSVILTVSTKMNDIEIIPFSLTLKKNGIIISTDVNLKTIAETIDSETTFELICDVFEGVTKRTSIIIESVSPIYYGTSNLDVITEDNLKVWYDNEQFKIQNTSLGEYSVKINDLNGEYFWICLPEKLNLEETTLDGIKLLLNEDVLYLTVEDKDYKCYRNLNLLIPENYTFLVNE